MQAGFESTTGKVTHVNFAQAARVRSIARAWDNIRAISAGGLPEEMRPTAGIWLELAPHCGPAHPAHSAEVIHAFGPAPASACAALLDAKRRAALEALL